jgi:methionyl-tRNA formyltransferase
MVTNAPHYKCKTGAVIGKNNQSFTVKTKDSFVEVTEWEYDGMICIGDRFQ